MANNELLSLLKPRSGNPYAIGGFSPKLVNSLIEQGTKRELLAEAKTLLPNKEALSKSIMDRNIFSGDKAKYVNGLNQYTSRFLKEYKKDPYYAFSKDARSQIKQMSAIANDPALTAMEQAKKTSDVEYEKAQKEGLDFNPVVSEGRIFVNRKGQQKYIPLGQLENTDIPISIREQYNNAIQNGIGTAPITYDMSEWSDVIDKVRSAATNLGTEGFEEGLGTGLVKRTKTQAGTYNERLKWLLNNGLSQADINTVQSEYVKRTRDVSPNTKEGSLQWLMDLTKGYLHSSIDRSTTTVADPTLDRDKKIAEIKANLDATMGENQAAFAVGSKYPELFVRQQGDNEASLDMGVEIKPSIGMGERLPNSFLSEGNLPLEINEWMRDVIADPSQPLVTPDGYEVNGSETIIDRSFPMIDVFEEDAKGNSQRYLYVTGITSNDQFKNDILKSKYAGIRDPKSGAFSKGKLGDATEEDTPEERAFTKMRKYIEDNEDLFGVSMLGAGESDLGDDDLHHVLIKIPVHDGVESIMRSKYDKKDFYSDKRLHTVFDPTIYKKQEEKKEMIPL